MEAVKLSQANQKLIQNKNIIQKETPKVSEQKKNGKKLLAFGALALSAIAIAGLIIKNKHNKAQEVANEAIDNFQKPAQDLAQEVLQDIEKPVQEVIEEAQEIADEVINNAGESFNLTSKIVRIEKLSDGTTKGWYENGQLACEITPDGIKNEWFENGQQKCRLTGTGDVLSAWYENGQKKYENGIAWHKNGQKAFEFHKNDSNLSLSAWYENGQKYFEKSRDEKIKNAWLEHGEARIPITDKEIKDWIVQFIGKGSIITGN